MVKQSLEQIFSEEHILAYSGVCMTLGEKIARAREQKACFDTLVIPSRGAFPFFLGMVYSLDKMQVLGEDIKKFYESLAIQPTLEPLMPKNTEVSTDVNKKPVRVLLIPFTADLNIENFDANEDSTEYVQNTRRYWANITASFFAEPSLRKKCPYFRTFTDVVLREVEKRNEIASIYESFPRIGKFAMIDTVISGRAANDILISFDDLSKEKANRDLIPHAFLIVDENGSKLERHPTYNSYLKGKETEGYIEMLRIPRIVSEDENASLLGVSAVVYPSIMRESKNLVNESRDRRQFFIGAGSWHIHPESTYMSYFKGFMGLIYSGIDALFMQYSGKKEGEELERFREERKNYLKHAEKVNILNLNDSEISYPGNLSFLKKNTGPYETSSHVLHVPLSERRTREIISKICLWPNIRLIKDSKENQRAARRSS